MAQIFDPLPPESLGKLLCCYLNATSKIQVARITNMKDWYFERVVFPGQRLIFEALPDAQLEIHTGMMASSILSDTIPCRRLSINEPTVVESAVPEAMNWRKSGLTASAGIASAAAIE
ncbi:MAG: DUF1830 domain-containing protein [Leptolyngbyaceae cyanobacterium MO_188.B28]|nr:DUF1830 domain-containing protein [Leptolyngbyaceae cyanobacterium MO_188.B28]